MVLTPDDQEQLHAAQQEILDVIASLCQKHNLSYFLAYGSCLGAVRHNGFIPWDDDIDIGMPRSDYTTFIDVCRRELPPAYRFISGETERTHWLTFGKVYKNGTAFVEQGMTSTTVPPEKLQIYVDVFPLEEVAYPDARCARYSRWINKIKVIQFAKIERRRSVRQGIAWLIPHRLIQAVLHTLCRRVNTPAPAACLSFSQTQPFGTGVLALENGKIPVTEHLFAGHYYPIPREYDDYLRSLYGDYMTLPPVEQRQTHAPVVLRFGSSSPT